MSDPKPPADPPEAREEVERREDEEGIPGYGQPPPEVRTLHLKQGEAGDWDRPRGGQQWRPGWIDPLERGR